MERHGDAGGPVCTERRKPLRKNVTGTPVSREIELVRAAVAGHREAWDDLYGGFSGLVRAIAFNRKVLPHDVEDIVQETFVGLSTSLKRGNYDPEKARLSTFIGAIAHHICSDYSQRIRPTIPLDEGDEASDYERRGTAASERPDTLLEKAQTVQHLRIALKNLSERCQEILWLLCCRRKMYAEIATLSGGTEVALRKQASRCRRDLQGILRKRGMLP